MMDHEAGFSIVTASTIADLLERDRPKLGQIVREAYQCFGRGQAVVPHSNFLRFRQFGGGNGNRFIALPAYLDGDPGVAGIKWIGSFPKNLEVGRPRATGILILNSPTTGEPFACLEGSLISAARTAASAVLGASLMCGAVRESLRIGFVGTGVIARAILQSFVAEGWKFARVHLFDVVAERSRRFAESVAELLEAPPVRMSDLDELLGSSDLIVFATTATRPYILEPERIAPSARILNISLRDLGPQIILGAENLVDDIEHCLREQTSPHLAEQQIGSRRFDLRNIHDCFDPAGRAIWRPKGNKPVVFSPFGLGILDLAVGTHVFHEARKAGRLVRVDNFFARDVWA